MLRCFWRWLFPPPRDPEDGMVLLLHLGVLRARTGLARLVPDRTLGDIADRMALRMCAGIDIKASVVESALARAGRAGWLIWLSAETNSSPEALASWWHTFTDSGPAAGCSYAGVSRRGACWVMILSEN